MWWGAVARRARPNDPFFFILGFIVLLGIGGLVYTQRSGAFDYLYYRSVRAQWKAQGINPRPFLDRMKEKYPNSPFKWEEESQARDFK